MEAICNSRLVQGWLYINASRRFEPLLLAGSLSLRHSLLLRRTLLSSCTTLCAAPHNDAARKCVRDCVGRANAHTMALHHCCSELVRRQEQFAAAPALQAFRTAPTGLPVILLTLIKEVA